MASLILPDQNILVYAHNTVDPRFRDANRWLTKLLSHEGGAAFCWETINGFVRLSTSHAVLTQPLTLHEAFRTVDIWFDSPNSILLEKTSRHRKLLETTATSADVKGPKFSDAVLATIAIEHNAILATTDADFARFDGLRVINPLAKFPK